MISYGLSSILLRRKPPLHSALQRLSFSPNYNEISMYSSFEYRACYEIENYVGRAFLNSKLCKNLVALLISYRTWTEIKTMGIFCKKGGFFGGIWISNIYLLPKKCVFRKSNDKFLFILKIAAHHDFTSEFKIQSIKCFFKKHDPLKNC